MGTSAEPLRVCKVDHQVTVDAFTGSARVEVPVPTTAARALTPPLVLVGHGTGGGNSVVGRGWALGGLPAITVDTREHLPRWDGTDGVALDGVPLVPWRDALGAVRRRRDGDYEISDLRPQTGFTRVRVEQWRHRVSGDVHYRSRDAADVLTIYGARPGAVARVCDPDAAWRVTTWLPEVVVDPVGNALWCEYAAEDARGIDRAAPWEPWRPCTAQRYLTRVRYGNVAPVMLTPAVLAGDAPAVRFAFALVVDHGDHGDAGGVPTFDADRPWPARADAFAASRDGFVVRTYRRVRRLVCFHDVPTLGPGPVAVAALELGYADAPAGAQLTSVRRIGYRDREIAISPTLTIRYAAPGINAEVATTSAGVGAPRQQLVDLYGEGLPGVLDPGDRGWLYRANQGGGQFAAPVAVEAQPNFARGVALVDRDRDGDTELAVTTGRLAGAFALDREDAQWRGFRPFARWPRLEGLAGRTFWIDLNGDGRNDAVIAHGAALTWFPSRSGPLDEVEGEFDDPVTVPLPQGPATAPGMGPEPLLDLAFADLNGDGLADLVRVRRGAIEYWPSLGNGRFGERVVMDAVPELAMRADFDSRRVRWVDLDGSGTADLVYLGDGEVWCCANEGGRRFGAATRVRGLPRFDARTASVAEVAGDGRAALVWTTVDASRASALAYLPLVPAIPPGAIVALDDGGGRVTELVWGNSAMHYLRDGAAGVAWSTRLPSHRPVVDARVERDLIGGTSVTTRYRYRDGYYDGTTGAFRGFGRVETLDTPRALRTPDGGAGLGDAAFAPPLLTRTWFHLGTPMWNHHRPFEPYQGDAAAPRLPPHVGAPGVHHPADVAAAERGLAGAVVRRERWAVDAREQPVAHPFDVEQASYQLVLVQPRQGRERPVFGQVRCERLVATYDGVGGDPRVAHELVVAFDAWGAPTRTAQVAYARRGVVDDAGQARTWITVRDTQRTDVDTAAQFVLGLAVEEAEHELVGVAATRGRIAPAALTAASVTAALATPAPFEQALDPAAATPAARRLAWQRTYYWNAARDEVAPLGEVGSAPRRHHAEQACLTPGLVAATLGARVDAAALTALGYAARDGHLWSASPIELLGGPFALPTGTRRGDGATTQVAYDSDALVAVASTDALGLVTVFTIDYRAVAPAVTVGPTGTAAQVSYDAHGRAVATGVEGHVGAQPWRAGTVVGWSPGAATLATVLADPASYLGAAATATFRDDRAWERDATPVAEVTVTRSALVDDGAGGGDATGPLEVRVRYLDGFGRVLQEKVRVAAGPAIQRDASGQVIVDAAGGPVLAPAIERWRVSGHVVYDAKGQPGRVYEPYFSPRAAYEGDAVLERFGVSTLTIYDAVGRPVRVDLPNGTYAATTYGAWATTAATPGDTVLDSTYRMLREGRPLDDAERVAYAHAAGHAGTPTVTHVDARGVACATLAVGDASAADAWTRQVLDATGQPSAVIDARGLAAFTYMRDLRGQVVAQTSVDAGPTWALMDAYDRPVWTWDGRGFAVARGFDVADRPTTVHVTGGDGATAMDAVVEMYRYGDQEVDRAAAVAANTLGRLVEVKDGAGVVAVTAYDPLGAVRAQGRQLRATVDEAPDWRGAEAVEREVLATGARTDALGREVWTTLVDGTVRATAYARGGAIVEVRVTTPDGALVATPIVADVARDAHGRVVAATLGNGVGRTWAYDPASGRLVAQDAVRGTRAYQGLRCTYDPDGMLVRMLDVAQDGPGALVPGAVSARRDFGYDAHGRLIEATGRMHQALVPHDGPTTLGCVHGARHLSLNNGAALERYTQRLTYDAGGNLTRMQHAGMTASWATDYWVAAGSNRSTAALDRNGVPVVNPAAMFDGGGNLTELWHLRAMGWSWRGCLTHAVTVARADGAVDDGERYAYGADRVRVRKVATRLVVGGADPVVETREVVSCGGGQERVRVRRNGTLVLERWTTHVSDGDLRVAVIDRHVIDTLANEVDAIGPARVRYHLTTPQGSTAVELDEAGQLISYEEYLPHGGSAFIAGDDVREVARRDVRYAGKERDRSTGLDAYPQRYYAPWLGRWLSPDPIGPKDGLNLYAFVGGDPVGYVDSEGTDRRAADDDCRVRRASPSSVDGDTPRDVSWRDWWAPRPNGRSSHSSGAARPAPAGVGAPTHFLEPAPPDSLTDPRGYDFGTTGTVPAPAVGDRMMVTPTTPPDLLPLGIGFLAPLPSTPVAPTPVVLEPIPIAPVAPPPSVTTPTVPSIPSLAPAAGPVTFTSAATIGELIVMVGAAAPGVSIGGVGYVTFTRSDSIAQFGTPYGAPRDCLGAPVICLQRGKPLDPITPVPSRDPVPGLDPTPDPKLQPRTAPTLPPYRWVPFSPADPGPGARPAPTPEAPEVATQPRGQHGPPPSPPTPVPSLPTATQPSPAPGPAAAPQPSPTPPSPPQRQPVNLDTGAIIATTSLKRPWQLLAMNAFLVTKEPLVTQTALAEFFGGPYNAAGPNERLVVAVFMMSVRTIPDSPSARVMALNVGTNSLQKKLGYNDRIIFGTGDQLGIPTVTADQKFVDAAARQGVLLWVQMIVPPPRYLGI